MSTLLPTGQIVYNPWYATDEGRNFLSATDGGQFAFLWEAVYTDGTVVRQFDEVEFYRAMTDEAYVPPEHLRLSVDRLDKERVSQFALHPIALTRKVVGFREPFVAKLRPDRGEFFMNHWLTDFTPKTGYRLRRHVIGIRKVAGAEELRTMIVISPSGQVVICADENQSYEGE